ncbi:MAG: hypothetical protein ACTIKE_16385, partial [Sphingobacterium sp.]
QCGWMSFNSRLAILGVFLIYKFSLYQIVQGRSPLPVGTEHYCYVLFTSHKDINAFWNVKKYLPLCDVSLLAKKKNKKRQVQSKRSPG